MTNHMDVIAKLKTLSTQKEANKMKSKKLCAIMAMVIALCSVNILSYAQSIPDGVLIARGGHAGHASHSSHSSRVSHSRAVSRPSASLSHSVRVSRPSIMPLSSTAKGRALHAKSNAVKQAVPAPSLPPMKQITPAPKLASSSSPVRAESSKVIPVANTNTQTSSYTSNNDGGFFFSIRNWFYTWWFSRPKEEEKNEELVAQ